MNTERHHLILLAQAATAARVRAQIGTRAWRNEGEWHDLPAAGHPLHAAIAAEDAAAARLDAAPR